MSSACARLCVSFIPISGRSFVAHNVLRKGTSNSENGTCPTAFAWEGICESYKARTTTTPRLHFVRGHLSTYLPTFPTPQFDDINVTDLCKQTAAKVAAVSSHTSSSLKPSSTTPKCLHYATQASHTSTNCPKWTIIKLRFPRLSHNIRTRSNLLKT